MSISDLKGRNLKHISKEALSEYLNEQPWTLWTTLSTGYELTLPSARRSIGRMFDRVSSKYPNTKLFWAAEQFDVKDGFHLHSLWSFDSLIWSGDTKKIYQDFRNDWKIVSNTDKAAMFSERYEKNKGAHSYLSKYITKEITDYDLFDSNSTFKDYKQNNVKTMNEIGRSAKANRLLRKYCEDNDTTIPELKKKYL